MELSGKRIGLAVVGALVGGTLGLGVRAAQPRIEQARQPVAPVAVEIAKGAIQKAGLR